MDGTAQLEDLLGVRFDEPRLLQQALVHRSYLNEALRFELGSNERLEFLGDAVLDFVIADDLYRRHPDMTEGELTSLRAALVRLETLGRVAARLDLGRFLRLSRGEEQGGGRARESLLGRALEALIGAIYLDRGLEAARDFIRAHLDPELDRLASEQHLKDPKSRLQETAQADFGITPSYRIVMTTGPEHAKEFTVEVHLGDLTIGRGAGRSKQLATQEAARVALEAWPPNGVEKP